MESSSSSPPAVYQSSCPELHKIAEEILALPQENRQLLFDAYCDAPYTVDFPMQQIADALGLEYHKSQ